MITYEEIVEWAEATFPKSTYHSVFEHFKSEVKELELAVDGDSQDAIADEIADCMMLLYHLSYKLGIEPSEAIFDKFIINQSRSWGEPNELGFCEHIECDLHFGKEGI